MEGLGMTSNLGGLGVAAGAHIRPGGLGLFPDPDHHGVNHDLEYTIIYLSSDSFDIRISDALFAVACRNGAKMKTAKN